MNSNYEDSQADKDQRALKSQCVPGGLNKYPPLPSPSATGVGKEYDPQLTLYYDADQMRAYAADYGHQCAKTAASIERARCLAIVDKCSEQCSSERERAINESNTKRRVDMASRMMELAVVRGGIERGE